MWFSANGLHLNPDKTKQLVCSLCNFNCDIESVKLLGIHIDHKLQWDKHIEQLSGKLSSSLYVLRKLKFLIPLEHVRSTYFALFHSHLCYGLLRWGNAANVKHIITLQKKAIRIISSINSRESCRPRFRSLKIMTIFSQYAYYCLLNVKKNISNFNSKSHVHNFDIRTKNNLDIPYLRLAIDGNHFQVKGLQL